MKYMNSDENEVEVVELLLLEVTRMPCLLLVFI